MVIKDLLKALGETDDYELLIWMEWYLKPGRIPCKQCIETRKLGSGTPPDCFKCGLPTARLLKQQFKKETLL